jgi:hypothetical protein
MPGTLILRGQLAQDDEAAAAASAAKEKSAGRSPGLIWAGRKMPAELQPARWGTQPTLEPAPVAKPPCNVTMLGVLSERRPESAGEQIERLLTGYGGRAKEGVW